MISSNNIHCLENGWFNLEKVVILAGFICGLGQVAEKDVYQDWCGNEILVHMDKPTQIDKENIYS